MRAEPTPTASSLKVLIGQNLISASINTSVSEMRGDAAYRLMLTLASTVTVGQLASLDLPSVSDYFDLSAEL